MFSVLLSSRNFATVATWRNDFSSLLTSLLAEVSHGKRRRKGKEKERPLQTSDTLFNVAADRICSRNLLVIKLVSFNVECACPVEPTVRRKFSEPRVVIAQTGSVSCDARD